MPSRPSSSASNPGMSAKRIKKEIADLSRENLGAITLAPNESNIFQWKATIPGPAGSPYEGGVFEVDIRVPEDYPFSPPHLQFITKLYHCNVASTGAICLDLLKHAWSPALSLYKVILSLSSLLTDPNPSDPLVPSIAQEYRKDRKKHDATAREWVKKYALPKVSASTTAPPPTSKSSSSSVSAHPRPRPISRPGSSNSVPTVPAQVAGSRRRAAIEMEDLDGGEDSIEIIDSAPSAISLRNRTIIADSGEATNSASGGTSVASRGERAAKRSRVNGTDVGSTSRSASGAGAGAGQRGGAGGSAGDAIVIDE